MGTISKSGITESRILITGATGFIGRWLVRRLAEVGARVWTTGLPGEQPPPGVAGHLPLDARDGDAVRAIVAEAAPQVVFHLTAVGVSDEVPRAVACIFDTDRRCRQGGCAQRQKTCQSVSMHVESLNLSVPRVQSNLEHRIVRRRVQR